MKEYLELRVQEQFAPLIFADNEGVRLGKIYGGKTYTTREGNIIKNTVRKVTIPTDDPRMQMIEEIGQEIRKKYGTYFFAGWEYRRSYTVEELASAEVLRLIITKTFEPTGEECGTVYDETEVCPYCKAGRKQVIALTMKISAIPKKRDFSRTIADEWIVSSKLKQVAEENHMLGAEFRPIINNNRKAAEVTSSEWFQLGFSSRPISTVEPTLYGIEPFDFDLAGTYKCPLGHVMGLNLLSELYLSQKEWDGSDFLVTKQLHGAKMGLLNPHPDILISQRAYQTMRKNDIKGFKVEVAHLV